MDKDPERALVLRYAPTAARAGLAALLALDDRLGGFVRAAREPLLAQMRLTWWFEALQRLDAGPPPAEPVLRALAAEVASRGVTGAGLAGIADAWERLLDPVLDDAALTAFGRERGGRLFAVAATVLGAADDRVEKLGAGWALAALGRRWSDGDTAARAEVLARGLLAGAFDRAWPRALRPLGALALLARADLDGVPPGSPRRAGRLLRHRLTGR